MRRYSAELEDVKKIEKYSDNFELSPNKLKIRQKIKEINDEIKLLGFG